MTGAELCRAWMQERGIAGAVLSGPLNAYDPGERIISLRPHCYSGSTPRMLTTAAHEAGHADQHADLGWMIAAAQWLMPGRLWLEWDASRRAEKILGYFGRAADAGTLRASWESYLGPAVIQAVLVGLCVAVYFAMRKH